MPKQGVESVKGKPIGILCELLPLRKVIMCRSKAQGGRRCSGKSGQKASTTSSTTALVSLHPIENIKEAEVLTSVVGDLTEKLDEIVFTNWADDNNVHRTRTLKEMQEGKKAYNHCDTASGEIKKYLRRHPSFSHLNPGLIEAVYADDNTHWALTLDIGEEQYILDYTARQFDHNADFPVVARKDKWLQQVSDWCFEGKPAEEVNYPLA